jgi:hypothetical protein
MRDRLQTALSAIIGTELRGMSRLPGGSKKGVYRLSLDDGGTAIAYVWADNENYWPAEQNEPDPFSHASGIDLFEAAHRRLHALAVRTPRIHLIDRSQREYPADIAVVEDVPGDNLEELLQQKPRAAETTLGRLAEALARMHEDTAPCFGKVAQLDAGRTSCEHVVLDRALRDLAEAAVRDKRIAAARAGLEEALRTLSAGVRPRSRFSLIHGELGPDHVLVDRLGDPVLIDIEGTMFFDVEWEHVFLRIRFGEYYRWLDRPGLDSQRLTFYELAMRLSLVAGPLRILDGDFPDRAAMTEIAEHNLRRALAFLPRRPASGR